jgi:hypothetical protein
MLGKTGRISRGKPGFYMMRHFVRLEAKDPYSTAGPAAFTSAEGEVQWAHRMALAGAVTSRETLLGFLRLSFFQAGSAEDLPAQQQQGKGRAEKVDPVNG